MLVYVFSFFPFLFRFFSLFLLLQSIINRNKSKIILPPNSPHHAAGLIQGIPVVEEIKILGIWFKANPTDDSCYRLNFQRPLTQIRHICESWFNRQLSIKGKVTFANSLLISLLQYPISVTFTPVRVIKEYSKILQNFIWDGKRSKIAYNTLILPIQSGGLRLFDLDLRIKSSMLQWIKRITQTPESNIVHYLSRLTGCEDLNDYFAAKRSDNQTWTQGQKFYEKLH